MDEASGGADDFLQSKQAWSGMIKRGNIYREVLKEVEDLTLERRFTFQQESYTKHKTRVTMNKAYSCLRMV